MSTPSIVCQCMLWPQCVAARQPCSADARHGSCLASRMHCQLAPQVATGCNHARAQTQLYHASQCTTRLGTYPRPAGACS